MLFKIHSQFSLSCKSIFFFFCFFFSDYYYYNFCFFPCFSFWSFLLLTEPTLADDLKFSMLFILQTSIPQKFCRKLRSSFLENHQERTTVISWCLPSKFCISRRQILTESFVKSSIQMRAASYSLPVLRCSDVTRTIGASANLP